MKKSSNIIAAMLISAAIIPTATAAEIPIESAPCNATIESITITENIISEQLTEVQNGMGFQFAWAKARPAIYNAVISQQTNGYGYADLANIARNALIQYRDMYLRLEYYAEQDVKVYNLIADLVAAVQNGMDYDTALDTAYTRIYQSIDASYVPNTEVGIDSIYLNIPAADTVMFSRARKFLKAAIPQK